MDPDPLWRLSDPERAQLSAWGLTAAGAAALPPSKNRTVLCDAVGGGRRLVKLATGYGQSGVFREGSLLGVLGSIARPPLRIPRLTSYSPELGMLALEWLEGATTAFDHHRTTRRYDPDLAERLGRALGALHARTHAEPTRFAPQDDSARFDLLESLLRPRPEFYARQPRAALHLISRLQQDGAAMRSLQSLSDAQQDHAAGCLIHGDCKQGNILLAGSEPVLIDWELASWGDGARDLGWLAADYATGWLAPEHESEVLSQPDLQRFLGALLRGYALERKAPAALTGRVVPWCGLALVVMAYAETHLLRALGERGQRLADFGQYLLAEPDVWRPKLFGEGDR